MVGLDTNVLVRYIAQDDPRQSAEQAWRALAGYRKGKANFADHLISRRCEAQGCTATYTFDKAAARDGGMTLIGARAAART